MSTDSVGGSLPYPDADHAWSVLHVRPRCEKKAAAYCVDRGYVVFLPLFTREHRYGARRRAHQLPLFPGYVFALLDQRGRSLVRGSDYVANLLDVPEQQKLVEQLDQIRRALESRLAFELMSEFKPGMDVELKHGPMKGTKGIVQRVKNNTRIVLHIDFIKQAIAVEVDADWLVPR